LILSSLIPHHLLLARLGLRRNGFASAIEAAFSVALSFRERMLFVRDNPSVSDTEDGNCNECVSISRGADVGAGPLDVVAVESCEDNDFMEGESNARVDDPGDARPLVLDRVIDDIRGL
jgi:hypothetical protein